MAPVETSAGFLHIAHRDLRAATAMVDSSVFEEDTWGFYLQQATEKALKAWLLVLAPEQPPLYAQSPVAVPDAARSGCRR